MIKEIFYTKNTLYIFLENNITKRIVTLLNHRLRSIVSEYPIDNIIIHTSDVTKLDETFYKLMESYPIQIKNTKKINNR